jgi:hypothetical protein
MKIDKEKIIGIVAGVGTIGLTVLNMWTDKQKEAKRMQTVKDEILKELQNSNK